MPHKNRNTKEFLLEEILKITKEGLVYANQYDVEKLTEAVKTREDHVKSLLELCKNEKPTSEEIKVFQTINEEADLLMEKMQICVTKLSNDLAILHDGKQVIKYF
jgi:GTPase Era involved in 16S rRNA processing